MQQLAALAELELRYRARAQAAQELYYNSLSNFVRDAWYVLEPAVEYVHGWHIDAMCEHLQAVTDGEITRLLINVPPGCMKSLLLNVFWPAWEWGVRKLGHYRYLCASHKQELAVRDSVKMRRLIVSDWYQDRFRHIQLANDQNAKGKFENTMTGFREAIAAGSITGSRGDRVIIDDPHSVDSANSDAKRESTTLWFREAVPTRLNSPSKSAILVIMQRLNDYDVSGMILSNTESNYTHLMLPMEFEKDRKCVTKIGFEDRRTEEGELLFDKQFPRAVVDKLKSDLGSYGTASQLQQSPVPRGGGIIKLDWINLVDSVPKDFTFIIQSYDTAFKTGQTNDYSVGITLGYLNGQVYVIDRLKGKFEYPELLKKIKSESAKYNANIRLIEDKASGQSLIQSLKLETQLRFKAVNADTDKIVRTHACLGFFEQNKFNVLKSDWSDDYIKTLTRFPYASHDDDVDATTLALNYLSKIKINKNTQDNYDIFGR
jgi:predicted phage terminase large subunit-like protein